MYGNTNNAITLIEENFVNTKPYVNPSSIMSFDFKRKQNGEVVGILRTNDGVTHIKTISPNGMTETTMIEIPVFPTNEDRNRQILAFYEKGYTQVDISIFMGLSQSQVSRILRGLRD
jgi:hypothetical protein